MSAIDRFLPRKQKTYCMKNGYKCRPDPDFCNAFVIDERFQWGVYENARKLADEHNYHSILDIGCGSGYKLCYFFPDKFTVGIDLPTTVSKLRQTYPNRFWFTAGFNAAPLSCDLVICADVIEHIPEPDSFLQFLKEISCKHIILSTPERELLNENTSNGPPKNPCHVREWSHFEFHNYISQWFAIDRHYIVDWQTQVIEIKR